MPHTYEFPRASIAVDLIIIATPTDGKDAQVLLVKRGKEPCKGLYAFPGGYLNMDETGEQAALREFKEETLGALPEGVKPHFWNVADKVDRDPRGRVISLVYLAQYDGEPFQVQGADDAEDAFWMPLWEVTLTYDKFAFDHADILLEVMLQHQDGEL